jgi:cytochrome c553
MPFPLVVAFVIIGLGRAPLAGVQNAPQRLGLCAACHGERGVATGQSIPNLAGQNLEYLRNALIQYQSGARDFPAMRAATGMLNAAELDQILQWYAQQPSVEGRGR